MHGEHADASLCVKIVAIPRACRRQKTAAAANAAHCFDLQQELSLHPSQFADSLSDDHQIQFRIAVRDIE
jgi:hypothetical protein